MANVNVQNSSSVTGQSFDVQPASLKSGQQAKSPGSNWFSAPGKLFGRNLKIGIDFSSIGNGLYQGLMRLRESVVRNFTSSNKQTSEVTTSLGQQQKDSKIEMLATSFQKKGINQACDFGISSNEVLPDDIVSEGENRDAYLNQLNNDNLVVKPRPMILSAQHKTFFPDSKLDAVYSRVGSQRVVSDKKGITLPIATNVDEAEIAKNVNEAEVEESSTEV